MLSDEERKAIERLKDLISKSKVIGDIEINKQVAFKDIEMILNLIEKQSKEIEELKVQNNKLAQCHFRYEEMTGIDLLLPDKLEYTSNDKIKAKIEELDKQEEDLQNSISDEEREEYLDASISWELMDIHTRREVLQSLLEKE